MNQRGFATLEVILMVMVIGILASIAVPRFTSVTTAANTAKIQADLTTIDTAIAIAVMEGETISTATKISDLNKYLKDASNIKPPKSGKCYLSGEEQSIPGGGEYTIEEIDSEYRAVLGTGNTSGKFTKTASSTNTTNPG